jgi:tripartite-type tricarboxylate transporter receptor subunit TctC
MFHSRARFRVTLACVAACLGLAASLSLAQAQPAYPERSVRFILPFGPGSATDIAARLIAEKLQAKWGRSIVVEPRPGGDGLIAINAFLAANDDHTLLYASTASFIVHPYTLQSKPPYDAQKDLNPIVRTADSGLAVAVSTGSGASTIRDFVELARKNPGALNVAGGAGLAELTVRAFVKEQGLNVTIVPYRDIIQAGADLGENRIQLVSASLSMPMPYVQTGKAKIAAIAAPRRTPLAPDVPSAPEAGFPTLGYESTVGFYGPARMSLDLRRKIAADVMEALRDKALVDRLFNAGLVVVAEGPEELAAVVRRQTEATRRLADILGMKPKD